MEFIDLRQSLLVEFPVSELAGAKELEEIVICSNPFMEIDRPLDALLENHPRLCTVKAGKSVGTWKKASFEHLVAFAKLLQQRNPNAAKELMARPVHL